MLSLDEMKTHMFFSILIIEYKHFVPHLYLLHHCLSPNQDQSGFLDEDEFRYAIEYLKLPVNDEILENLFYEYDYNYSGKIDYVEFREIFLRVCDLRKELEDREIDLPTLIRKKTMRKMFREVLIEEETKERRAMAEARRCVIYITYCDVMWCDEVLCFVLLLL